MTDWDQPLNNIIHQSEEGGGGGGNRQKRTTTHEPEGETGLPGPTRNISMGWVRGLNRLMQSIMSASASRDDTGLVKRASPSLAVCRVQVYFRSADGTTMATKLNIVAGDATSLFAEMLVHNRARSADGPPAYDYSCALRSLSGPYFTAGTRETSTRVNSNSPASLRATISYPTWSLILTISPENSKISQGMDSAINNIKAMCMMSEQQLVNADVAQPLEGKIHPEDDSESCALLQF